MMSSSRCAADAESVSAGSAACNWAGPPTKGGAIRASVRASGRSPFCCVTAGGIMPNGGVSSPGFPCIFGSHCRGEQRKSVLTACYIKALAVSVPASYGNAHPKVDIATGGRLKIARPRCVDNYRAEILLVEDIIHADEGAQTRA